MSMKFKRRTFGLLASEVLTLSVSASHIDHSIEKQIASCWASIPHACQNNKDQTTRYFSHVDIVKLAHQRSTFDVRRAEFQYKWATYLFVSLL
jgi:hypothetical protein